MDDRRLSGGELDIIQSKKSVSRDKGDTLIPIAVAVGGR